MIVQVVRRLWSGPAACDSGARLPSRWSSGVAGGGSTLPATSVAIVWKRRSRRRAGEGELSVLGGGCRWRTLLEAGLAGPRT